MTRVYAPAASTVLAARLNRDETRSIQRWLSINNADGLVVADGMIITNNRATVMALWGEWIVMDMDTNITVMGHVPFVATYRGMT